MNIKRILAMVGLLFSASSMLADDVDRNSEESLKRPHLIVTGTVKSVELVRKEDSGAALMKAAIEVQSIQRQKELSAKDGETLAVFYRTGRPQRPKLPELSKGADYRLYLRQMEVEKKQVLFLEFEDDSTKIGKGDAK